MTAFDLPLTIALMYPARDPVSPKQWSGTPRGLFDGLSALGVTAVGVGYDPGLVARAGVRLLAGTRPGRREVVERREVLAVLRGRRLRRELLARGPVDGVIAMGTDVYLPSVAVPSGVPVATYDDGTFAQFLGHPDSDVRRVGFPQAHVRRWADRQRQALVGATACCMSTPWAARSAVSDYGVAPERVHVVGMGHRPRAGLDQNRDWGTPHFLFVGIDWGRKNGEAVLRGFRAVRARYPSATLDVVGAHPPLAEPGVVGHGLLPREDAVAQRTLDQLFARATAFVLPSRFDPSPIAYLEAASAGLPVVATTEGGAGELLGEAALSVHPDDDDALTAAMLALCEPSRARRLGHAAAERAADMTWRGVAGRILDCLSPATHDQAARRAPGGAPASTGRPLPSVLPPRDRGPRVPSSSGSGAS